MDDDKSATANFAIKTYSLTVTANNGSVTKSPSASSYDCGTEVSLTANPNTGWHFVRWEGDIFRIFKSVSITGRRRVMPMIQTKLGVLNSTKGTAIAITSRIRVMPSILAASEAE